MVRSRWWQSVAAAFILSCLAAPAVSASTARAQAAAIAASPEETAALRAAEDRARQEGLGKIPAGSTGETIAKAGLVIFVLAVFTVAAIIIILAA